MSDILAQVVELLSLDGKRISGFEGDVAHAEAEAILSCRGGRYCLVRDWIIIRVNVPAEFRTSLADDGLEPVVLYASDVVLHSANTRQPGDFVRTTFSLSAPDGHVFRTRNTTYVLMGPGLMKEANMQTVMAITN
jgi:hypothetical protein